MHILGSSETNYEDLRAADQLTESRRKDGRSSLFPMILGDSLTVEARARSEALKLNLARGRRLRRPRRGVVASSQSQEHPRLHGCTPVANRTSIPRRDSLSFCVYHPFFVRRAPENRHFSRIPRETSNSGELDCRDFSSPSIENFAEVILRRIKIQVYNLWIYTITI